MIKLISIPVILVGIFILYRTLRKENQGVYIEEIELSELSKIWIDSKPVIEKEAVKEDTTPVEIKPVEYDENTGEIIEKEPDLLERVLQSLMKLINVVDDNGRCGVFTLFDTDNVYVSQKQISTIAENLSVTEDEIIAELEKEGYINSGYKLYKVHYRNQSKPLVYKNLNLKLFCTGDIELRKGNKFLIVNIEEVKVV